MKGDKNLANDLQGAVKRALILGFSGAVLLPVLHECYANISGAFAVFCIFAGALTSGILYAKFTAKNALVSITAQLALTGALGLALYFLIHPATVYFLNRVSKYFSLSYYESFMYYATVLAAFMSVYVFYGAAHLVYYLVHRSKSHGEKLKNSIDNAFDD